MNKKRILKWVSGVFVILVLLLIGVPFFLEARIGPMIRQEVNRSINGTFDFARAELSLIRNFPNARIALKDVYLLNSAPFEGDTLLTASGAHMVMGIGELFREAGQPITLQEVVVDQADLRLRVDGEDRANYLISSSRGDAGKDKPEGKDLAFSLQEYRLNASRISYEDQKAGLVLELTDVNHSGSGDLSLDDSRLQTRTDMQISFRMDSIEYLSRNKLTLRALIGMDFRTDTYTFLKNEGSINQMPLVFEGSVRLLEEGQEVKLHFQTPDSAFKNFLALIPEGYSGNLEGVSADGTFSLQGNIQGVSDASRIPDFEIRMEAREASYKYPDLPMGVEGINFSAVLRNETGRVADTYLEISDSRFTIDSDTFLFNGHIYDFTGNTRVDARLNGRLNLGNISRVYPVEGLSGLSGRLQMDIRAAFDMEAIEKRQYDKVASSGTLEVEGLNFKSESFTQPVKIETALLRFDPSTIRIQKMEGSTGNSDFNLQGNLRDYLGAFFSNADLMGNLELYSENLVVDDFQAPESPTAGTAETAETGEGRFQIPSYLDIAVRGRADRVLYDNLRLNDLRGELQIRDQRIVFNEVSSKTLDGTLTLVGELSTEGPRNTFDMDLGMTGFNISETFASIELLRTLAPIAGILEGRLNSSVSLSGALKEDFSPDLMSLAGKVAAEVLPSRIKEDKAPVLAALNNSLGFVDLKDLDLNTLKTSLSFENGRVEVKPFNIRYRDIDIQIKGEHTFDQQLNYRAVLLVPSRYLGPEVNRLVAQLNDPSLKDLKVPITAEIGGNYKSPEVRTDLKSGVEKLGTDLVALQKQRMLDEGSTKAGELLGGLLGGNQRLSSDTVQKTRQDEETGLGELLKVGERNPSDSTAGSVDGDQAVQKAARDLLGGLLGKKKKDTTKVVRDSLR